MVRIGPSGPQPQRPEERKEGSAQKAQGEIPRSMLEAIQNCQNPAAVLKAHFGVDVPANKDKLLDALEGEDPELIAELTTQSDKFAAVEHELNEPSGLGASTPPSAPSPISSAPTPISSAPTPSSLGSAPARSPLGSAPAPSSKGYTPDSNSPWNAPPQNSPLYPIWQIIQVLQQLPPWYANYLGGPNPSSPADMLQQLNDLQTMINKIPTSDPRHQQLQDLYNKDAPVVQAFAQFAKTDVVPGSHITFEDLVLGATEGDWSQLTGGKYTSINAAWSALEQNPTDSTLLPIFKNIANAVQSAGGVDGLRKLLAPWNSTITPPATGTKITQITTDLLGYNSTAYTILIGYIAENPNSGIDDSWLNNAVFANYAASIQNNLASVQTEWVNYLKAHGQSDTSAAAIAATLAQIYGLQGGAVFQKYHAMQPPKCFQQPDPADISFIGHMLADPSTLAPQAVQCLIQLGQAYAPVLSELTQLTKFMDQVGSQGDSTLAADNYQLQLDLHYLNAYIAPDQRGPLVALITPLLNEIAPTRKGIVDLGNQGSALSSSINSAIGNLLKGIFSGNYPTNITSQAQSEEQSITNLLNSPSATNLQKVLTDLSNAINGSSSQTSIVQQIIKLNANFKTLLIGTEGNRLKAPQGFGVSVWFDTSYISDTDPLGSFEQYLQQAMDSGITELKLSFTMFASGSVVDHFLKELSYKTASGQTLTGMQAAEAVASQYGIKLSVSVGGENASSLQFPPGMTAAQFAQQFYNEYLVGAASVDFDLEGAGLTSFLANGHVNITQFFQTLHALMSKNGQQLQLTVAGNILDICPRVLVPGSSPPKYEPDPNQDHGLEYLFGLKPPVIDRLNLMLYDSGSSYYITKGTPGGEPMTSNAPYAIDFWIDMLVRDMGITPAQAISMLGVDFQDKTPYNSTNSSVTRSNEDGGYKSQLFSEIQARTGKSISDMTPGEAANEIRQQLLIDVCKDYNIPAPAPGKGPAFAPQSWWIDESRVPPGSPNLCLSAEADAAADALANQQP